MHVDNDKKIEFAVCEKFSKVKSSDSARKAAWKRVPASFACLALVSTEHEG
jgi:hypothetical protein